MGSGGKHWCNQALQLFVCFSFCRILATTWCPLFRVFEVQVCLWFVSIIFLPNLKETVPFMNRMVSRREFHCENFISSSGLGIILSFASWRTCSHAKLEKFFRSLHSRQLWWARSWRLGLAPMSLSSPSCKFIRRQNGQFYDCRKLIVRLKKNTPGFRLINL